MLASVSKEARLEACRDCAARRRSAESSAATSAHASVGRSSGGASPSSGGRKSVRRCSATSVRSACARTTLIIIAITRSSFFDTLRTSYGHIFPEQQIRREISNLKQIASFEQYARTFRTNRQAAYKWLPDIYSLLDSPDSSQSFNCSAFIGWTCELKQCLEEVNTADHRVASCTCAIAATTLICQGPRLSVPETFKAAIPMAQMVHP